MKRLIKARVAKILLISILFTQNGILEIPGAVEDMNTAQIESPDSKATKIVATSSNTEAPTKVDLLSIRSLYSSPYP